MQMVGVGLERVDEVRLSRQHVSVSVCGALTTLARLFMGAGGDVRVLQDLCILYLRTTKVASNEKTVDSRDVCHTFFCLLLLCTRPVFTEIFGFVRLSPC